MKTILSILFLFLAGATAMADTTEHDAEFFHPAASLYIQGDVVASSNLVVKGLSLYPEDGKLLRLKELLEKQQEQEKEQQQNDQEQQNQEQNEAPQNEENQNPPESNEEEQQQPSEPQTAEQMTEDEAKQLLDAMKQEEKNKRMQLHPVLGAPVKVDKDW